MLAARIDRLPPEDKALLQTASVDREGRARSPLLQAIAELPEDALRRGLARLQAAEFLYEAGLFPDLEYTFKHALTHEVAYGSLLQDRRRALHGQIVEAIERLYPDRLAEHVERLAHHAFRGEAWDKAVTYLRQAGAKAFARSAHREAVAYFEQALAALTHLPETRETLEQAIDLRFDLRNSLFRSAEFGRIERISGKPKPWPGRSTISDGSGGCRPTWQLSPGRTGRTTDVRTFAQTRRGHRARRSAMFRSRSPRQYYRRHVAYLSGDYRRDRRHLPEVDAAAPRRSDP